jgi:hypothetical protein
MESDSDFRIDPFPLEKEFRLQTLKPKLKELNREELEDFLIESLGIMTKLAHQVSQMSNHIQVLEGKKKLD